MSSIYLEIEHDQTKVSEVFATPTGVTGITILKDGTSLGTLKEDGQTSRTLDSFSVHVTGATREVRAEKFSFLLEADSVVQLQALIDRFTVMSERIGRNGSGTLYYRSATGTKVTRYKLAEMSVENYGEIAEYESFFIQRLAVTLLVDPLGLPWGWDANDDFSFNTIATQGRYNRGGSDWTKMGSGYKDGVYQSGAVFSNPAFGTGTVGYYYTGLAQTWEGKDFEITAKFIAGTGISAATYQNEIGMGDFAGNYIAALYWNSVLYVQGPFGLQSTIATSAIASNQAFWIVLRRNTDTVVAELWLKEPRQCATPDYTVTLAGVSSELAYIDSLPGTCLPYWFMTPGGSTDTQIDNFKINCFKFRNYTFPSTVRLRNALHVGSDNVTLLPPGFSGTYDAQAAVNFSMNNPGSNNPAWIMFAWWPIPPKHNLMWNGNAENIGSGVTAYGWQITAYSSLTAAATSITEVSTAAKVRSGFWAFEVVCPATNNTGVAFPIYSKSGFKKGFAYRFRVWVRSDAATTAIRASVGTTSTNRGISANKNLSTSWQLLSGAFIPAVDTDEVAAAVTIQAATGTTFHFDDFQVYEDFSITDSGAPDFDGGGYGPGIIPAIGYDSAKASVSSDGAYFSKTTPGSTLISSIMSGSGVMGVTANLEYHLLPHCFVPDEFTAGEVDIAVFARVQQAATQIVNVVASILPDNGSSFGSAKYSEFYNSGKQLTLPGSTIWKLVYVGTITVKANRNDPQRMKLRLSFTNTGASSGAFAVDYLVAVPAKNIAASRSGVQSAFVPPFIPVTGSEITKRVASDLSVVAKAAGQSSVQRQAGFEDASLLLNRIMLPKDGCDFLALPSITPCDNADTASLTTNAATHTATMQVEIQPQVHLLNQ